MTSTIGDAFRGVLLGQALGDALGAPYEGLTPALIAPIRDRFPSDDPDATEPLQYTDDTQMAIVVAEALAERGSIETEALAVAFAERYDPGRCYGPGARRILEAIREGGDARELARTIFPGGSLGNGGAMRAAPIGVFFHEDLDRVAIEAEKSALPTHVHPIGIEGARLIALGAALAVRSSGARLRRRRFFAALREHAATEEFQFQLNQAAELGPLDHLGAFGSDLEAHRSVTTALLIFACHPDDYATAVRRAIGQGHDTDTLAAMVGALAGARLGVKGLPARLLDRLEDGPDGRSDLIRLADRLEESYRRMPECS